MGFRATITGEIRNVKMSEDGKFVDLAVLQDGAVDSVKCWGFADAFDGQEPEVGQSVDVEVYAAMKKSKRGNDYLSIQLRKVAQVKAGARPLRAA